MATECRPYRIFWTAVILDMLALGIAWSAWKTPNATPVSWVVAAAATLACVTATTVAGRILVVVSHAPSPAPPTRSEP